MKRSIQLKNLSSLLYYYFDDTLKGALDRGFLKKKINRYMLILGSLIAYFAYFISNMKMTGKLVSSANNITNKAEALRLLKMTIMSYTDMYIILSIAFFIFLNSTISLTRSSIYITNILPFSKKEAILAQKLYKMIIGLILFEGIQILVFPFVGSIQILTTIEKLLLLLLFHVVYISVFLSLDSIYQVALGKFNLSILTFIIWILDSIFIILAGIYFYIFRFKVEIFVSELDCSAQMIIGVLLLFFGIIFFVNMFSIFKSKSFISTQTKSTYIFNRIPAIKLNLPTTFPLFYRHKNFVYSLVMLLFLSIIMYSQGGMNLAAQTFSTYYFIIPLVSLYYADATSGIRKMFNSLRISLLQEICSLLFCLAIILLPQMIVCYLFVGNYNSIQISILVFIVALLSGLLFPKSKGNLNETISSILVIFIIVLIYSVIKFNYLAYPTIILFLILTSIILKQERSK